MTSAPDYAAEFSTLAACINNYQIYAGSTREALLSALRAMPFNRLPCDAFAVLGWLERAGRGAGAPWRWREQWLAELQSNGRLTAFYMFVDGLTKS